MNILVTGGAGYIGSHTLIELIEAGHKHIVIDNLVNSSKRSIERVESITKQSIPLYIADVGDAARLEHVFDEHTVDAVIHFAGLKAVGESVKKPLEYYQNNLISTITLLQIMHSQGIKKFVFSSSATVYGDPESVPITEDMPANKATNPYGQTKSMIEQILFDLAAADSSWQISLLRYFNPVGAHKSGLIGEDPRGTPNNLMPYIAQVAIGKRDSLAVFGNDYNTPDGTGVRDYIHVVDLARGHVAAIEHLPKQGARAYNLGTGHGCSVLEMIAAFESASQQKIPYTITDRRSGDIACCYADPTRAKQELHWTAAKTLKEMCIDTWRWQSQNPNGYDA